MLLNNLAELYWTQHRYSEAEPLLERALEVQSSSPHRDDTGLRTSLAWLYRAEGKDGEAERLLTEGTERSEKTGEKNVGKFLNLKSLAEQYQNRGSLDIAETTYEQAIAGIEREEGPDDPYLLPEALESLGGLYHLERRDFEAETLFIRALKIREKAAGPEHPDDAGSLNLNYLLNLYRDQGRLGDIEPFFERALEIQEETLGPDHRMVVFTLTDLASIYREQGKYQDAARLYKRVLEIQERNLRPDDPRLADALARYAESLQMMNRETEAAEMRSRAEAIRQKLAARHGTR